MLQVDAGSGTVILACRMDARWIAKAAQVFGQSFCRECRGIGSPSLQTTPQIVFRLCHSSLRIVSVIRFPLRLGTITIATQIGEHYGKCFSEARRDLMPHDMSLRVAMQQ